MLYVGYVNATLGMGDHKRGMEKYKSLSWVQDHYRDLFKITDYFIR